MELELKERFEDMVELSELVPHKVVYKFFDYHHECQKNNEPVKNLIDTDLYPNYIKKMGLFELVNTVTEVRTGSLTTEDIEIKVVQRQKGVVRTNCVDCLDRTNIV